MTRTSGTSCSSGPTAPTCFISKLERLVGKRMRAVTGGRPKKDQKKEKKEPRAAWGGRGGGGEVGDGLENSCQARHDPIGKTSFSYFVGELKAHEEQCLGFRIILNFSLTWRISWCTL